MEGADEKPPSASLYTIVNVLDVALLRLWIENRASLASDGF